MEKPIKYNTFANPRYRVGKLIHTGVRVDHMHGGC